MNPNCPPEIHPFTNRWFNFNEQALTPEATSAWVINQEKSYFGFLPNRQIKHLIIGSFPIWASVHHDPPHAGFDFAFFYCSRVNGFFKFLETLSGYNFFPNSLQSTPHEKVQSITDFFLQKPLGITDVIEKAQRTDARCNSSLDKDLRPLAYNDLCQLLADYKGIVSIYFTSRAVERWYRKQLKNCLTKRSIQTYVLFSPAPIARVPAKGILNRDLEKYGYQNSLYWHLTQIPFINDLKEDTVQLRVAIWAKRFRNIPDFVRPEILNNIDFTAIENRL